MPDKNSNFRDFQSISAAVIGFTDIARAEGFKVGPRECQDVLRAAQLGTINQSSAFYYCIKSIYCQSVDDLQVFDRLYDHFWKSKKMAIRHRIRKKNNTNIRKETKSSLVLMGWGNDDGEDETEGKNVSGGNSIEQLRQTDFSKVAQLDSEFLEELALKLWRQMSLRLKKKYKYSRHKGYVDIRKTIRKNIHNGGNFLDLMKRYKKLQKNRLVMLLDVSGSMDKYSFFLLRFIWALKSHFKQVEVFLFSTKLIRATSYLDHDRLDDVLVTLSQYIDHWSGGTKIGECLAEFNRRHAKKVLAGRSMTIVLSDGLDTGDPELLSDALANIKKRTKQLVWLNPLKGMNGYEPIAKGMKAALPYVDHFKTAHNLDSLLSLEKILADV